MSRNPDYNELIKMGVKAGLTISDTMTLASIIGIIDKGSLGPMGMGWYKTLESCKLIIWNESEERFEATKEGLAVFRKLRRDTGTLAQKLRLMYPPGMKDDRWPWRGTPKTIKDKLDDFIKDYPDVTDEEILKATSDYLSKFKEDMGRSLLGYFIGKVVDGDKRSILAEYVYSSREEEVKCKIKSSYDQL